MRNSVFLFSCAAVTFFYHTANRTDMTVFIDSTGQRDFGSRGWFFRAEIMTRVIRAPAPGPSTEDIWCSDSIEKIPSLLARLNAGLILCYTDCGVCRILEHDAHQRWCLDKYSPLAGTDLDRDVHHRAVLDQSPGHKPIDGFLHNVLGHCRCLEGCRTGDKSVRSLAAGTRNPRVYPVETELGRIALEGNILQVLVVSGAPYSRCQERLSSRQAGK